MGKQEVDESLPEWKRKAAALRAEIAEIDQQREDRKDPTWRDPIKS